VDLFFVGEMLKRTCDRWLICSSRCLVCFHLVIGGGSTSLIAGM
jgi:hypothetical protein